MVYVRARSFWTIIARAKLLRRYVHFTGSHNCEEQECGVRLRGCGRGAGHQRRPPAVLRGAAARLIAGAGARLLFLPPYSPDLNPIEMAFAKFKELLRQAQARTVDALWDLIGRTLNLFTPEECGNYIRHCGYNPL
jgi:hypothetical protein